MVKTVEEKRLASNAACKRWREKNPEYNKKRQQDYWALNSEKKAAKHKRWYDSNHESALEKQRESYHRNKDNPDRPTNQQTYRLFISAKKRASISETPFTITRDDIHIPEKCEICDEEMIKGTKTAPSLDRVHPELGYTKENTKCICRSCNTVKSFGTAEHHRKIAEWIDRN